MLIFCLTFKNRLSEKFANKRLVPKRHKTNYNPLKIHGDIFDTDTAIILTLNNRQQNMYLYYLTFSF